MKPIITKAQIRSELEDQIQDFLHDGGAVTPVARGESGHLNNQNLFAKQGSTPPPQSRTPVDEAVKALEERKHPNDQKQKSKGRRKKLITDDFGEPLRWVWVEN